MLSHLRAIDWEYIQEEETSDCNILIVLYTSCLVLCLLHYVVLDMRCQREVALFLLEETGFFDVAGAGSGDLTVVSLAMRVAWSLGCVFVYLAIPLLV